MGAGIRAVTNKDARFWNWIARRYAKQPVADEAAYQAKLEKTREYFSPETEVLEIGCGTGSTAIAHAPYVKHIRAVDISEKMIAIAEGKAASESIGNIRFECAAVDDLDVADTSLDAVLALSILHLVSDRGAVIADIHRMLKPGGVFISSTACLGDKMGWLRYLAAIGYFLGLLPLLRVFRANEFTDSVTAAGFEIDYQWHPDNSLALFIVAKKRAV